MDFYFNFILWYNFRTFSESERINQYLVKNGIDPSKDEEVSKVLFSGNYSIEEINKTAVNILNGDSFWMRQSLLEFLD